MRPDLLMAWGSKVPYNSLQDQRKYSSAAPCKAKGGQSLQVQLRAFEEGERDVWKVLLRRWMKIRERDGLK